MSEITSLNTIGAGMNRNLFSNSSDVMGKDDFLRILVTQLQNQDPINPANPDEFAAQLAQFSSLEQLQNMNTNLLNNIELDLLLNQAINNTMATTLIGKTVKATGNKVELVQGQSADINFALAATAKTIKIKIEDENGNVVRTIELQDKFEGDHKVQWDGKNDSGDDLEAGKYTFNVTAEDINGEAVAADEFIVGMINSIRYNDGNAILLIGDLEVTLADVKEISVTDANTDNTDSSDENTGSEGN